MAPRPPFLHVLRLAPRVCFPGMTWSDVSHDLGGSFGPTWVLRRLTHLRFTCQRRVARVSRHGLAGAQWPEFLTSSLYVGGDLHGDAKVGNGSGPTFAHPGQDAMIVVCQAGPQPRKDLLRSFRLRWGVRYTRGVLGSTMTPSEQHRRVLPEFPRGAIFSSLLGSPNPGPFFVPRFGSQRRNPSQGPKSGDVFRPPIWVPKNQPKSAPRVGAQNRLWPSYNGVPCGPWCPWCPAVSRGFPWCPVVFRGAPWCPVVSRDVQVSPCEPK